MPTISVFYGIVIQMHWRDHAPPHFHAIYGEFDATITIGDWRVLSGSLPRRAMAMVREWAAEHESELIEDWNLCRESKPPMRISPLRK
jgi:hypothetical protein